MTNGFLDRLRLNGIFQHFVDQRLVSALAGFGFEVFDNGAIKVNIHVLLRRQQCAAAARYRRTSFSAAMLRARTGVPSGILEVGFLLMFISFSPGNNTDFLVGFCRDNHHTTSASWTIVTNLALP